MKTSFYFCPICGNVVLRVLDSGVTPTCCNKPMLELKPNTIDASQEKHVPVITHLGKHTYRVTIGAEPHPMTDEHHIEFIYLATEHGGQLRYLEPGSPATADFVDCQDPITGVYAYCNLHGLWYRPTPALPQREGDCKPEGKECKRKSCGKMTALLAMFFPFLACSCPPIDNTPVEEFDLNQYIGKWYEIARFDHIFERDLDNCVAEYSWNECGDIKVVNTGWKEEDWKVSEGCAKTTDIPGLMRVSFFWPFYSDYRVLMLNEDYSIALVGSKRPGYLWILARTPQVDQKQVTPFVQEARRRGYNTRHLIWVNQEYNKMWE